MEYFTNDSHLIGFKLNKNKKFNHPTPYDLADSYDGIPEVKLKYEKTDFCPCGSGNLYLNCKNNCYPAWGYIQKQ